MLHHLTKIHEDKVNNISPHISVHFYAPFVSTNLKCPPWLWPATHTNKKSTIHPTKHKHTQITAVSPRWSWQAAMYTWWCYHHISHIAELMFLRGHWWGSALLRQTAVRTPSSPSPNFLLLLLLCPPTDTATPIMGLTCGLPVIAILSSTLNMKALWNPSWN